MNPNLPRRDLITGSALAAGLALLNDAVGADNPAANVADRTSSIKISALAVPRGHEGLP